FVWSFSPLCSWLVARLFGGWGVVVRTGFFPPLYSGGCTPVWGVRGGGSNRRSSAAVSGWVHAGWGGAGWWVGPALFCRCIGAGARRLGGRTGWSGAGVEEAAELFGGGGG